MFNVTFTIYIIISLMVMLTLMFIFERGNTARIIFWAFCFLLTNAFGFVAYIFLKLIEKKKKLTLIKKLEEDEIYKSLYNYQVLTNDEQNLSNLFDFTAQLYSSPHISGNSFETFDNVQKVKSSSSRRRVTLFLNLQSFRKYSLMKF